MIIAIDGKKKKKNIWQNPNSDQLLTLKEVMRSLIMMPFCYVRSDLWTEISSEVCC